MTVWSAAMHTDVRFGSKADICTTPAHVRFNPTSGHWQSPYESPLGAVADIADKLMPYLCFSSRFSLAQKSRIESRIALRGNHTLGGSQASENIALTRRDSLAILHCVSFTTPHNIVRKCNASCGQFSLALFKALVHVVCQHWHATALFLKLFAAS
jgi:hypothetical protein